jgi:hypothetical protein
MSLAEGCAQSRAIKKNSRYCLMSPQAIIDVLLCLRGAGLLAGYVGIRADVLTLGVQYPS